MAARLIEASLGSKSDVEEIKSQLGAHTSLNEERVLDDGDNEGGGPKRGLLWRRAVSLAVKEARLSAKREELMRVLDDLKSQGGGQGEEEEAERPPVMRLTAIKPKTGKLSELSIWPSLPV